MYSSSQSCHTATGTHMPHGITQCYLPLGRGDIPALTPAEAGTRLSDPGGMQGCIDLVRKSIDIICVKEPITLVRSWSLSYVSLLLCKTTYLCFNSVFQVIWLGQYPLIFWKDHLHTRCSWQPASSIKAVKESQSTDEILCDCFAGECTWEYYGW